MSATITIDPVTRIEGHARVFLDLAPDGSLASAGLVVNELRGLCLDVRLVTEKSEQTL